MKNYNTETQLKVDGKMSERDAGIVGKMQATALIIVSLSTFVGSISFLIWVMG